jgi:hypothetical protein
VALRLNFAVERWRYLLSFDFSVALVVFVTIVTDRKWFSSAANQTVGVLILSKILNTMLRSSADILSLVLFVFMSDKAWDALTGLVESSADAHLGLTLEGDQTVIALGVIVALCVVIWVILLRFEIPQTISHAIMVLIVSVSCLPAIRTFKISANDIRSTKYCCRVSSDEPSDVRDRCPLEWPGIYWLIAIGLFFVALAISYRVSEFRKKRKAKKQRLRTTRETDKAMEMRAQEKTVLLGATKESRGDKVVWLGNDE